MTVYIITTGEYDDYSVELSSSLMGAVNSIKAPYVSPYVVEWSELKQIDEREWKLTASFEHVPGFSTKHSSSWFIEAREVL